MKTNENIQYLRGVAALTVVFAHTVTSFAAYRNTGGMLNIFLQNIELIGQVGVGVFFVISGYIMSLTTNDKAGGINNAKTFAWKRVIRIYPLYIFWTTVVIVLGVLHLFNSAEHYSLSKTLASYLLIPYISYNGDVIDPILRQGWTLMYEIFFYITFAVLIFLGQHRKSSIYILMAFFFIAGIASKFMTSPSAASFFSFQIYFLFVVGVYIFHYQERILNLISSRVVRVIMLAIFTALVLLILFKYNTLGVSAVYVPYIAAIFLFLYVLSARKVSGVVLEIGNSSYSLYLTHMFSTTAFAIIVIRYGLSNLTLFVLGVCFFLVAILVGEISYRLIEKRLIFKTAAFVSVPTKLKKS